MSDLPRLIHRFKNLFISKIPLIYRESEASTRGKGWRFYIGSKLLLYLYHNLLISLFCLNPERTSDEMKSDGDMSKWFMEEILSTKDDDDEAT